MTEAKTENGFDVCVTNGSQDSLSKIFEMVGKRGDIILMDNPCYAGTLAMVRNIIFVHNPIQDIIVLPFVEIGCMPNFGNIGVSAKTVRVSQVVWSFV